MRAFVFILILATQGLAEQSLAVDKLVEFIHSSITQRLPDKEVSSYIATVRLTGRLDDNTVEQLRREGAGPKTVAALSKLVTQSAALPAVNAAASGPRYVAPPPPPMDEQRKLLETMREGALNYTKSLPDFICLQVTRRLVDKHYQAGTLAPGSFSQVDRLVEKVSYFERKEKYELISRNDNSYYGKTWESAGGSISRGEFGSLLRDVFDPNTHATFGWDHLGRLRNRLCYVFNYQVERVNSDYSVSYDRKEQISPGYHGLIYVEKATGSITRLTIEPDMPRDFPIQDIHQTIDYDYFDINGNRYLLPFASDVQSRTGRILSRNEIEFRRYQKYSADTSIKFEDADEPPVTEDQKKEQAPKP